MTGGINRVMDEVYPGDTPSKAIARAMFWHRTAHFIRSDRPAVVLASRQGCDVQVLQRLGFPPDQIVAVDRNPRAIEECRRRHPGAARYFVGNVEDVLERENIIPSVALLDYCAQPCADTVRSMMRVGALQPKRLGVVFQAARERPGEWIRICSASAYARKFIDVNFAEASQRIGSLGYFVGSVRARKRMAYKAIIRQMATKRDVSGLIYPGCRVIGDWFEFSPWLAIRQVDSSHYFEEPDPRFRALIVRAGGIQEALSPFFTLKFGRPLMIEFSVAYRGWKTPMAMTCYDFERIEIENLPDYSADYIKLGLVTDEDLREMVERYMEVGMLPRSAAALFGVEKQTAIAWKAVATRRANESRAARR